MFSMDGIEYNAEWVFNSMKQKAEIINGDNSGRLQGTKEMYLEYLATFFNHSGQIVKSSSCSSSEWDNLFTALANPINLHTITFPFNQGYITSEIYISSVERTLVKVNPQETENKHKWSNAYDVEFVAVGAQWFAGGSIQGYSEG